MVKQKRVNLRIEEDLWQSAVHAAEHESRELGLPISATTIITMGIQREAIRILEPVSVGAMLMRFNDGRPKEPENGPYDQGFNAGYRQALTELWQLMVDGKGVRA